MRGGVNLREWALPLTCLPASSPRERGEASLPLHWRSILQRWRLAKNRSEKLLLPVYGEVRNGLRKQTKSQLLGFSSDERRQPDEGRHKRRGLIAGRLRRLDQDVFFLAE
jgi:hypothetical protein